MSYITEIAEFKPGNEQERQDKKIILDFIEQYSHKVLFRENEIAHITSSGFIMNESLDKVLMVHHNIYDTWAWTGGHADGEADLLQVAVKEAKEETGIKYVVPFTEKILSIDILPVYGHMRKGKYVNAHLHLSVAYVLITGENETLRINKNENSGVKWIPAEKITEDYFAKYDAYLYNKLIKRARDIKAEKKL